MAFEMRDHDRSDLGSYSYGIDNNYTCAEDGSGLSCGVTLLPRCKMAVLRRFDITTLRER